MGPHRKALKGVRRATYGRSMSHRPQPTMAQAHPMGTDRGLTPPVPPFTAHRYAIRAGCAPARTGRRRTVARSTRPLVAAVRHVHAVGPPRHAPGYAPARVTSVGRVRVPRWIPSETPPVWRVTRVLCRSKRHVRARQSRRYTYTHTAYAYFQGDFAHRRASISISTLSSHQRFVHPHEKGEQPRQRPPAQRPEMFAASRVLYENDCKPPDGLPHRGRAVFSCAHGAYATIAPYREG